MDRILPASAPAPHPDASPTVAPDAAVPHGEWPGPLTRFVLVETSHPGNIGAAARAMKVMGFRDLVLVRPRFADALVQAETVARASGAADVLVRARTVATLAEALDGVTTTFATAMTPRDFGPPTAAPRTVLPGLAQRGSGAQGVAFVFGSERYGLSNEDVYRCQACLSIPTAPDYGSLNLAQAVQLLAYEWRQALGGFDVVPRAAEAPRADAPMVDGVMTHWQQVLTDIGFHDPAVPRRLLPRLRRWLMRSDLRVDEAHILRGIATAVQRVCGRR